MLDICEGGNAKVREATCKAIGEFCAQYFQSSTLESTDTASKDRRRLISSKVSSVMLLLARESNASARAMAMFALGNLAYVIRESKSNDLIEISRVRDICRTAFLYLEDSNDKVVGNSIRCCGHAGNLLARFLATEDPSGNALSPSFDLIQQIIDALAKKGSVALAVAMNGGEKTTLTWKQRSAAKKHGWGAYYSLGLVFEEISVADVNESIISSICTAAQHLLLCQQHYESLHEKVFLAAESAICAIPSRLFVQIGVRTGCVGKALSNAIVILHQSLNVHKGHVASSKKVASEKSTQQNQAVIIHLLPIASITDAYTVLLDDRITHDTLETFYTWMVEQPDNILDAHAFEIFALALERFGGQWSDNVSLEQRFASRALQKCKLSPPETLLRSDSNEDEADEI
jgi:hypothetical protein